jgi:predicted secreted protein
MSKAFKAQGSILQSDLGAGGGTFTEIAEVTKIARTGGKSDMADVTNMDSPSAYREYLPTLLDAGDISIDGNYLGNQDASQASFQALFDNQTLSTWEIVLPQSFGTWTFSAYVSAFDFDLPHDKQATFSAKLKITGKPSFSS